MKKFFERAAALLVSALLLSPLAVPAAGSVLTVSAPAEISKGKTFTVTVTAAEAIEAAQFTVEYDTDSFAYVEDSAEFAAGTEDVRASSVNAQEEGKLVFVLASTQGVEAGQEVASFQLERISSGNRASIAVTGGTAVTEDGKKTEIPKSGLDVQTKKKSSDDGDEEETESTPTPVPTAAAAPETTPGMTGSTSAQPASDKTDGDEEEPTDAVTEDTALGEKEPGALVTSAPTPTPAPEAENAENAGTEAEEKGASLVRLLWLLPLLFLVLLLLALVKRALQERKEKNTRDE